MLREEWEAQIESLRRTRDLVAGWNPVEPEPAAVRCERSRHRTLAHLRACQEQWSLVVDEFLARENPSVTVLHPWRKFEQAGYASLAWEAHLAAFLEGRERWLEWQSVDFMRGGKMNRKPETIGSLTKRLAQHEAYHVKLIRM